MWRCSATVSYDHHVNVCYSHMFGTVFRMKAKRVLLRDDLTINSSPTSRDVCATSYDLQMHTLRIQHPCKTAHSACLLVEEGQRNGMRKIISARARSAAVRSDE